MIVKKQIKIKVELYNFADRGYMHNCLLNISTISISPNRTNWLNNKIKRGNLHLQIVCISLQCKDQTENPFSLKDDRRKNG